MYLKSIGKKSLFALSFTSLGTCIGWCYPGQESAKPRTAVEFSDEELRDNAFAYATENNYFVIDRTIERDGQKKFQVVIRCENTISCLYHSKIAN